MTAPVDFAMLPPEINSGRMYMGPGAGPMLSAAAAWNGLAAELRAAALGYDAVLSELTGQAWHGPASAAMAAAAEPYVAWLSTAAAQAEQTAAQAEVAVAAYEAAFDATVPPPVIAANRVQLMVLIATNFFGQNTSAIAATEAEYAEMWAQDAGAMYGYAGTSAAASQLTPFDPPARTTDPAGTSAQPAAVSQAASTPAGTGQSVMSTALQSLADPAPAQVTPEAPSSTPPFFFGNPFAAIGDLFGFNPFAPGSAMDQDGLNGVLNAIFGTDTAFGQFINAEVFNDILGSHLLLPAAFAGLGSSGGGGAPGAGPPGAGAAPGAAAAPGPTAGGICTVPPAISATGVVPAPMSSSGTLGASVAVSIGDGGSVGSLSVPPGWYGESPLSSALGTTPLGTPASAGAAPSGANGVGSPPMPMAGMLGAQGEGRAVPQYGFRPHFVAHPPAAG